MNKTTIKHAAADQKAGMTFNELQLFALAGMKILADSADKIVKVRTTWRGTIRSLEITLEHDET